MPFDITGQQYNVLRYCRAVNLKVFRLTIAERMIESARHPRMIDRPVKVWLNVGSVRMTAVVCRITQKGLKLLTALDAPCEESNHKAFRGLSPPELKQLTALLMKTRKAHESQ